ncbi:MAG TPA: hypothetical protein VM098_01295, partial [Phycisphaerae bacterium]|nr:hypothetical protein [Phycisphaerae bacterium]
KHHMRAEEMIRLLKDAGRGSLHQAGVAPKSHPVFSADSCHLYKSDLETMRTCVRYIEANFQKHNLPKVTCDFVTPYDNWPYHKARAPSQKS